KQVNSSKHGIRSLTTAVLFMLPEIDGQAGHRCGLIERSRCTLKPSRGARQSRPRLWLPKTHGDRRQVLIKRRCGLLMCPRQRRAPCDFSAFELKPQSPCISPPHLKQTLPSCGALCLSCSERRQFHALRRAIAACLCRRLDRLTPLREQALDA